MNRENPTSDLEMLAALLDGRLQGEERARAIRQVASDPDSVELFTQSAQALEEEAADEEDSDRSETLPETKPTLPPNSALTFPRQSSHHRRNHAGRWRTAFSIAATLAAVATCFVLLRGTSSAVTGHKLAATLQETSDPHQYFSFGTRGGGKSESMAKARRRAVQVGAYTLQLQVEIASGGTQNLRSFLLTLSSLVRDDESLETIPEELTDAASGTISPQELRRRLSKWEPLFAQRYGSYFDLGRWGQMVYIASAPGAHDLGALRSAPMRQLHKGLWEKRELLASRDEEVVELLERVRRLADQPVISSEKWEQLHRATKSMLKGFTMK